MVHPSTPQTPSRKALSLATQSAAFFLPIILAAAYLNMGQTCCGSCPPPPPPDFLVSKDVDGNPVLGFDGAISADGTRIAFLRSNPVLQPPYNVYRIEVFVHDVGTGQTTWVDMSSLGFNSLSASQPDVSADGRFVVFLDLVDLQHKIILRDLDAAPGLYQTVWEGPGVNWEPTISGDGRYVAFSTSVELGSGWQNPPAVPDTNGVQDVWIRDRWLMTYRRASLGPGGVGGVEYTEPASLPKLSRDGAWITFQVGSEVVLTTVDGSPATRPHHIFPGEKPSINDDGSLVAYESQAHGETHNSIFVFDRDAGTHERVSLDNYGDPSARKCIDPIISGDGRFVAFHCLDPMTSHGASGQVYVRDLLAKTNRLASVNPSHQVANQASYPTSITADGGYLVMQTHADNIGPGDGDVHVYRIPSSYWQQGFLNPPPSSCFPQASTLGAQGVLGIRPAPEAKSTLLTELIWNDEDPIVIQGLARENEPVSVFANGSLRATVQPTPDGGSFELLDPEPFHRWEHELSSTYLSSFFHAQTDTRVALEITAIAAGEFLDLCGSYPDDNQHTILIRHPDYGLRLWDTDLDGVDNEDDNCPTVHNPAQSDADGDGTGDFCENVASSPSYSGMDDSRLPSVRIQGVAAEPTDLLVIGGLGPVHHPAGYRLFGSTTLFWSLEFNIEVPVLSGKTRLVAFGQTEDGRRSSVTSFEVEHAVTRAAEPASVRVVDVEGDPIFHARVRLGNAITYTNELGEASLAPTDLTVPVIEVSAPGYLATKLKIPDTEAVTDVTLLRESTDYLEGPAGGVLTTPDGVELVVPPGAMVPGQSVSVTSFQVDLPGGDSVVAADITPDQEFAVPVTLRIPNLPGVAPGSFILAAAEDPSRLKGPSSVLWKRVTDDGLYTETQLVRARGVGLFEPFWFGVAVVTTFEEDTIPYRRPKGSTVPAIPSEFEAEAHGSIKFDSAPLNLLAWGFFALEVLLGAGPATVEGTYLPETSGPDWICRDIEARWNCVVSRKTLRLYSIVYGRDSNGDLSRSESGSVGVASVEVRAVQDLRLVAVEGSARTCGSVAENPP